MRLSKVIFSVCLLLAAVGSVMAQQAKESAPPRVLPERVGDFKKSAKSPNAEWTGFFEEGKPFATEHSAYVGKKGAEVSVSVVRFRQDGDAYATLSDLANKTRREQPDLEIKPGYGTAGYASPNAIIFFRGPLLVRVASIKPGDSTTLDAFVFELGQLLDKGDGDIPVLVRHLPNAEEALKKAVYTHGFSNLNHLELQQPVLSAVEADGNADAALVSYGPSKLLLIEFHTPQLATDNDKRVVARIQELWKLGQPAPTAYRRVGNYSVFVFDAPDEATAKRLIDEVKYEQVVQWLGENPNIYKEAQKQYINTTLGVLVAVLKASGYALVACLGLGALIGGLLFSYRRAQQKAVTFSDAGGMLRLNLDELTAQTDPGRLLRERN